MTVLEKKAASGVNAKRLGQYFTVAVLAIAIGVGAAAGTRALVGSDELTPSQIAEIRGAELAEHAQSQWIAQVNATRGADMVEFHANHYFAQLAGINDQRAQDMVEVHTNQYFAQLAAINDQRAQDMVTFKRGWEGETGR